MSTSLRFIATAPLSQSEDVGSAYVLGSQLVTQELKSLKGSRASYEFAKHGTNFFAPGATEG